MIIFIPVRNGGHYLRTALDSIVAQTSANWRVVILENFSTDDTLGTIEDYEDARITCHPAHQPLDIVRNWQRATTYLQEHRDGDELMTFIGHDDYFAPEFVERIEALVTASPDATLFQTAFDLVDSTDQLIRPCRPIPATETWTDMATALCWGLRDSFGTGYAFRVRDYLAVGGIPGFPLLLSSDHLLFVRLARLGHKRTDVSTSCAYRLHAASTSGGMSRAKLNAHVEGLAEYVGALVEMGFAEAAQGQDALACLLGRELWTLRLPPVTRVLSEDNRQRCTEFEAMFDHFRRGLDLATWADPEGGRFARLIAGPRRLARAMSLYRQTRK